MKKVVVSVFQPFLRFYTVYGWRGITVEQYIYVSTLLEILHAPGLGFYAVFRRLSFQPFLRFYMASGRPLTR